MSDQQTTYQKLAAPFDLSDHAKVNKGSGSQTYAPWTSYVERLNTVLDKDWSFRVIREGFTPTECWVLGEITAVIDGVTVVRQQYGCEPITKGQRETPTADLLKTAASDAIKKAASLLGCGLYLSIKEEREAVEAAMREAVNAAAVEKRVASTPKVEASAKVTGAAPKSDSLQQRWERLVAEAERVNLPTLGRVKAIDPKAVGEAQMKKYADQLEERLYEAREAAGAA